MKQETKIFCSSFFAKIFILALLVTGGGNCAWGDTAIVDGNTIASGWTNGGAKGFVPSNGNSVSYSSAFIIGDGQITPATTTYGTGWNSYTWYTLNSNEKVTLYDTQKIEISAKGTSSSSEVVVAYSTDGSTWTNYKDFTTEVQSSTADFSVFTVDNLSEGEYYLLFAAKATLINSIKIAGDGAVVTNPKLSVSPSAIAFGYLRANDTQTVTVTNTGVGSMDVAIASDNSTDFTLSATELTGIGEGESKTFNVTFNYNEESLGEKTANITVTPSYNVEDAKSIAVTATAADATVWEDFSSGIPDTWYNSGFVTNRSGYEGQAYSSSSSNVLRTPRLYAHKDDELNFYVTLGGGSMTARYYTNSRSSYTTISSYSTSGQKTFVAPSDGYYWIEFTGAYNGAVDNFSGFSIAGTENLMELGSKSIPSTGTVGGDYTAWVTLRELGGNNETYTAQLYYDDEVVAEKEGETINGNRTETASFTFTPSVVKTSKPMYIKIIYNNGERELTTASENVTMSTTSYVFDETGTISRPGSNLYTQVVQLKYTAQHGWNTICVPFLLTDTYLEQIFGEGYTVYKINSFIDGVLYFQKTTSYAVSTPYLVYAENEDKVAENIYLKGVGYNTSNDNSANKTQTKGTGTTASFIGTFDPITGMEGKYGVTTAGKLGKGSDKASIKGYRAYIETSNPEARLSMVIDDDGETTDLGFVRMVDKDAKDVYNLQGQKVKKSGKGIYVVNGRKVVIK